MPIMSLTDINVKNISGFSCNFYFARVQLFSILQVTKRNSLTYEKRVHRILQTFINVVSRKTKLETTSDIIVGENENLIFSFMIRTTLRYRDQE